MSEDVRRHYELLEENRDKLLADGFLSKATGVHVSAGEVMAAIDSDGLRHLLIPTDDMDGPEDRRSRGVILVDEQLGADDSDRIHYVDLVCLDSRLDSVFERLVEDVLNQLDTDDDPRAVAIRVLDEWRALLRTSKRQLGRESAIGLIGELEVLRVLVGELGLQALDAWRGPLNEVHDFVMAGTGHHVEVKTTEAHDANSVRVSSLDQLDPDGTELVLAVVDLQPSRNAPSLDDRVDHLIELGLPRHQLLELVEGVGHEYGRRSGEEHRYSVKRVRTWNVGESFPGLRRSDLRLGADAGVSGLRYTLSLDAVGEPRLGAEAVSLLIGKEDAA